MKNNFKCEALKLVTNLGWNNTGTYCIAAGLGVLFGEMWIIAEGVIKAIKNGEKVNVPLKALIIPGIPATLIELGLVMQEKSRHPEYLVGYRGGDLSATYMVDLRNAPIRK